MKIAIIHLSDIHFQIGHNVIVNRYKRMFDVIKNELISFDKIILLTSGDIANTGIDEEYKKAKGMFDYLKDNIEEYLKKPVQFVFVPGNHDCFFEKSKEATRNILLSHFQENGFQDADENTINILCEPQNNFFKFIEQYTTDDNVFLKHKLLTIYNIPIGDENSILRILAFNTSWDSKIKEEPGIMGYPLQLVQEKLPLEKATLTISIIHHPLNWQKPENGKEFKEFLVQNSDLVLSGHEHNVNFTLVQNLMKKHEEVFFIESNPLQEKDRPALSSFNLVLIDTEKRSLEIKFSNLKDGIYELKETSGELNIERKIALNKLTISEAFLKDLDNPGASFRHSGIEEVKLSDVYIGPDLNNITTKSSGKDKRMQTINSNMLFSNLTRDSEIRCVFFGEDSSGKTLLWKYYYKKLFEQELIPIFVSGAKITEIRSEKILELVGNEYRKQYNHEHFIFEQLDFKKIVIFIDDFHHTPLAPKFKASFITNLSAYFTKIFVIGNDLMQLELYADGKNNEIELFSNFSQYLILEFGHILRYKLVQKWYHLGSDLTTDSNDILRKIDFAISHIDSIIGPNLIPSYPFFILTVLQTLENEGPGRNEYSIPGFYYQYLITDSLKDEISDQEEMGFYFKFMSEYCFHLFETKTRFKGVFIEYFEKFYNKHCELFDIANFPFQTAFDVLLKSKIVKLEDDHVLLGYKYIYYYFTAQAFAENITEPKIREYIELMSDRLYREEYSNILVFLTHLSKDPFIISQLLDKSQKLFSDHEFLKLESDVEFINKMQDTIPEAVYENIDVEKAREEENLEKERLEREKLDEEHSLDKNESFNYDINEDISTIDAISRITMALRTLNILGQITRKYWGELKGDIKFKLAEETFKLGLRTIKYYFELIEANHDGLVSHLKKLVTKDFMKNKIEKEKITEISNQFFYNLCSLSIFGVVKRISNAVGYEKLNKTFEAIEEANPYNSIKLINTSIKLDHSEVFPWDKIEEMKKKADKNYLVHTTLQNLVINYLYLYRVQVDQRQRICDLLGIKMSDQRLIAATSVIKKEAENK